MTTVTTYMHAFFTPIWEMIEDTIVPGFNVSFLVFYVCVFLLLTICCFINRIINIGLSQDLGQAIAQKRGDVWQTEQRTFNADGTLKTHTFTISKRSKYKK